MALTRNDVIDVLTACAAFDNRRVGETDIAAWAAALRPELTRGDALEAVRTHYAASADRAMPAHVNGIARRIQRDRAEQRHNDALREQAAARNALPNPNLGGLPIPTEGEPVWAAYDVDGAIDRPCVLCGAQPGEACVSLADPGRVLKIPCVSRLANRKIRSAAIPPIFQKGR